MADSFSLSITIHSSLNGNAAVFTHRLPENIPFNRQMELALSSINIEGLDQSSTGRVINVCSDVVHQTAVIGQQKRGQIYELLTRHPRMVYHQAARLEFIPLNVVSLHSISISLVHTDGLRVAFARKGGYCEIRLVIRPSHMAPSSYLIQLPNTATTIVQEVPQLVEPTRPTRSIQQQSDSIGENWRQTESKSPLSIIQHHIGLPKQVEYSATVAVRSASAAADLPPTHSTPAVRTGEQSVEMTDVVASSKRIAHVPNAAKQRGSKGLLSAPNTPIANWSVDNAPSPPTSAPAGEQSVEMTDVVASSKRIAHASQATKQHEGQATTTIVNTPGVKPQIPPYVPKSMSLQQINKQLKERKDSPPNKASLKRRSNAATEAVRSASTTASTSLRDQTAKVFGIDVDQLQKFITEQQAKTVDVTARVHSKARFTPQRRDLEKQLELSSDSESDKEN